MFRTRLICVLLRGIARNSRVNRLKITMTPNPNKWSHYLRAISTKIEIISTTKLVILENSSDLSSGRRPVSESEEFSKITNLGIEICGRQFRAFPEKGYTYWDFGSTGAFPQLVKDSQGRAKGARREPP